MDELGDVGMLATIGLVVLLVVIVVPLALRSARRGQAAAAAYNQGPTAKTGLAAQGSRFAGSYQGYAAFVEPHFDFNWAGMVSNLVWGKGVAGGLQSMGRQTFFHRYEFGLRVGGARFPATAFCERDWWGVFGNVEWQRRKPPGEKLASDPPGLRGRIDVYATDAAFAAAFAADPGVLAFLNAWPYLNLVVSGEEVALELIHHWNELSSKLGKDALMSWDFSVRALDGMVAVAKAAQRASAERGPV